jgi:hypothetical protein
MLIPVIKNSADGRYGNFVAKHNNTKNTMYTRVSTSFVSNDSKSTIVSWVISYSVHDFVLPNCVHYLRLIKLVPSTEFILCTDIRIIL